MQAWINGYMGIHSSGKGGKEKDSYSELGGKEKKNSRSRQDSNLRGQSPMDF